MRLVLGLFLSLACVVPAQAQSGCHGGQGGGQIYYAQPVPACASCQTCPTCAYPRTTFDARVCGPVPAVMETRTYGTPGPIPAVMETRTYGPVRADPAPTGFPVPSITIQGTFTGSGAFYPSTPTPAPQVFKSVGYKAPVCIPCASCPGGVRYVSGYELPTPVFRPAYNDAFGGCSGGNCPSCPNCPGGYCPNGQCQPRWR